MLAKLAFDGPKADQGRSGVGTTDWLALSTKKTVVENGDCLRTMVDKADSTAMEQEEAQAVAAQGAVTLRAFFEISTIPCAAIQHHRQVDQ